jgi:hypothetical protein
MRTPKRPADFTVRPEDTKWPALVGKTFRAYENYCAEPNGAIPPCAKRMCHFYRRETCMIEDYGHKCVWPYFWRQVDKDGNILDRDGWIIYTKEKAEEIEARLKR